MGVRLVVEYDTSAVRDIKEVTLWHKPSDEPDIYESWIKADTGTFTDSLVVYEIERSAWRWFINTADWEPGPYDFRLIAHKKNGRVSWDKDRDPDGRFDDGTYNPDECDMETFFVPDRR